MNLFGKTAIVTGAARGLGRAYATRLFEMGVQVVVADKADVSETVEGLYGAGKSLAQTVDVTDIKSVEAMVAATMERFGKIDILVNNAALYGGLTGGRADALSEADWDACMAVNVKGVWNCCRAVIPHMRGKGGSIINIASLAAVYGMPFVLHYATSKAAVIGMTRALARELGRDNIRVNAVAPTAIATEGTTEFFGDKLERGMQAVIDGQSLKTTLEADDVAGTILYLAGDASKFVTGQTIMVDGGTVFL